MTEKRFNQCLDLIRKGDNSGLRDIYDEYYQKMIYTAVVIVKDLSTAEDIASDVIKYILEKASTIPHIKNSSAWIYTTAKNRALDFLRQNKRTVSISICFEEVFSQNPNYELGMALVKSLNELSDEERDMVIMFHMYGFSQKEISQKLNKPIGTIKSSLSRIKQKMKHLKEYLRK